MVKFLKDYDWPILLAAVFIFCLFFVKCERICPKNLDKNDKTEITSSVTVTKPADSALREIKREPKQEIPAPKIVYVPVPANADTAAILRAHFLKAFYSDTIYEADNFRAVVNDTITQNRIFSRKIFFQNLRPQTTTTHFVKVDPKRKIFIGASFGGNLNTMDLGPSLLYLDKKENAYSYTYNIFQQQHFVNAYWKINLKK